MSDTQVVGATGGEKANHVFATPTVGNSASQGAIEQTNAAEAQPQDVSGVNAGIDAETAYFPCFLCQLAMKTSQLLKKHLEDKHQVAEEVSSVWSSVKIQPDDTVIFIGQYRSGQNLAGEKGLLFSKESNNARDLETKAAVPLDAVQPGYSTKQAGDTSACNPLQINSPEISESSSFRGDDNCRQVNPGSPGQPSGCAKRKHLREVNSADKISKLEDYTCAHCDMKFGRFQKLKAHWLSVYAKIR